MKSIASLVIFYFMMLHTAQSQIELGVDWSDTSYYHKGYKSARRTDRLNDDLYWYIYFKNLKMTRLDSSHTDAIYTALVAVDNKGTLKRLAWPTALNAPTINNNVTRRINSTTYTVSTTRYARVYYSVTIVCSATLATSASGSLQLQYSTNGGSTWINAPGVGNANSFSLAVAIGGSNTQKSIIAGEVPPNALLKMVPTSSGTTTITYNDGQEVLYN